MPRGNSGVQHLVLLFHCLHGPGPLLGQVGAQEVNNGAERDTRRDTERDTRRDTRRDTGRDREGLFLVQHSDEAL